MLTRKHWKKATRLIAVRAAAARHVLFLGGLSLLMCGMTGCGTVSYLSSTTRPMDSLFIGYRDHVWANRAYNMAHRGQSRPLMSHHRKGFVAGYCDVCRGGDGYVPALPPDEYWSYEYQSSQGQECVRAWFDGYPAGVAAARQTGVDRFRDVYVSEEVKAAIAVEQNGRFLPSDVAIVESEKKSRTAPATIPTNTELRTRSSGAVQQLPRIELPWMNPSPDLND